MENLEYWRLLDELTLVQAALLIIGKDPSGYPEKVRTMESEVKPAGFDAVYAALRLKWPEKAT